jgi:hypothetical protein
VSGDWRRRRSDESEEFRREVEMREFRKEREWGKGLCRGRGKRFGVREDAQEAFGGRDLRQRRGESTERERMKEKMGMGRVEEGQTWRRVKTQSSRRLSVSVARYSTNNTREQSRAEQSRGEESRGEQRRGEEPSFGS